MYQVLQYDKQYLTYMHACCKVIRLHKMKHNYWVEALHHKLHKHSTNQLLQSSSGLSGHMCHDCVCTHHVRGVRTWDKVCVCTYI